MNNSFWMETFTGKRFNFLDATIDDVDIGDIAHSLSLKCRFSGMSKDFISVAEHSIHVSKICPNHPLEGLLHDAAEAYTGDISRPFKMYLKKVSPEFREAEERIERLVAEKFNLIYPFPPEIKEADNALLLAERKKYMNESVLWDESFFDNVKPYEGEIYGNFPQVAESWFLRRYNKYMKGK